MENEIPDPSRWHGLLREGRGREIEGIRPCLLRKETLGLLDELRRFRHGFRTPYRFDWIQSAWPGRGRTPSAWSHCWRRIFKASWSS